MFSFNTVRQLSVVIAIIVIVGSLSSCTGKEFLKTYTTYLKEIPDKVKLIANEPISDTEKIDQLKELGTPAIPYIFDVISNGHQELSPALDYLTDNKSKGDIRKWSVENVEQLNLLTNFFEK